VAVTEGDEVFAASEDALEDECEDDDFEDCDDGLAPTNGGGNQSQTTVFGAGLTKILYWMAVIFGVAVVAGFVVNLLWRKFGLRWADSPPDPVSISPTLGSATAGPLGPIVGRRTFLRPQPLWPTAIER